MFRISLIVAIVILSICFMLTMVRFVIGPSLPDRVTAFDLFAANVISIIAIFAILTGNTAFMDVAIVLSLISFLGSMSFAYYMNNKLKQ
jgi:multicomponent Na+:H+ antiporter subunit F